MKRRPALALTALLVLAAGAVRSTAQQPPEPPPAPTFEGFLCCNMHSDGKWISDINYRGGVLAMIPAGTPVKVTGQGRWRVFVEIGGKAQALGNDYSRTIGLDEFARRLVVAEDPRPKIAAAPPKVREAIQAGKIAKGMTREQVIVAIGHPVTSYNDKIDAPLWRYWLDRSSEYQVFWGDDGRVERLFGSADTRSRVWLD
jgi:hypothetical protein